MHTLRRYRTRVVPRLIHVPLYQRGYRCIRDRGWYSGGGRGRREWQVKQRITTDRSVPPGWRTDGTRDHGVIPYVDSARSRPQRSSRVESRGDGVVTVRECQSTPRLPHDRRQPVATSNTIARVSSPERSRTTSPVIGHTGTRRAAAKEGEKKKYRRFSARGVRSPPRVANGSGEKRAETTGTRPARQ